MGHGSNVGVCTGVSLSKCHQLSVIVHGIVLIFICLLFTSQGFEIQEMCHEFEAPPVSIFCISGNLVTVRITVFLMGSIFQRHLHLLCIKSIVEKNESPFPWANSCMSWPGYHLEPIHFHIYNLKTIPSSTPEDFCTFLFQQPSSLGYFS